MPHPFSTVQPALPRATKDARFPHQNITSTHCQLTDRRVLAADACALCVQSVPRAVT